MPASPDSFVWLRLYLATLPPDPVGPDQPVWWTDDGPGAPLDYDAMRAGLRRVDHQLATN